MTVRGEIVQPARVPVRAFPRILVTSAEDPESRDLALAVARHLELGRSAVDRLDREAIDRMRAEGQIGRATAVLELRTTMSQRSQAAWGRDDNLDCGPLGCLESPHRTVRAVPVLSARVLVIVADGPSGRPLQRVQLSEEERGADLLAMRMRVLERLAAQTMALVDQRIERVPVHLYPVDVPEVREAIATLRDGRWHEGRAQLEAFVDSPRFEALPSDQRARVLYDLGQARRFDGTLPAERRFREARSALRAAVRLVPVPLYAQAIAELEEHRQSRAMVRVQREAMAHNFALPTQSDDDSPLPPQRYQR